MPVRMRFDDAEIRRLLQGESGEVVRHVQDIVDRTVAIARREAPVGRTGHLRQSIQGTVDVDGDRVVGRIGSTLEYALYVHDGTGLWGPWQRVIRPVQAKVLAWKAPGTPRGMVFAAYVKGARPNPFLTRAFERACPYPVIKNP
ncbi:HK97 gp10 family phage protein [Nonomuraea polychroma]|uniref:HK97 gp10 family phage protein n=1 Tax=Nonomuraea polychroma TaxID=46176 RepID=UPI003D8A93DD